MKTPDIRGAWSLASPAAAFDEVVGVGLPPQRKKSLPHHPLQSFRPCCRNRKLGSGPCSVCFRRDQVRRITRLRIQMRQAHHPSGSPEQAFMSL
jgi:hypothetical protein